MVEAMGAGCHADDRQSITIHSSRICFAAWSNSITALRSGQHMRAFLLCVFFVLSGCVIHVSEKNLVIARPGEAIEPGTSQDGLWKIDPISIQADSGVVLRGAWFRKPQSTATILYFGGNGFVLSKHYSHVLRIYKDLPVDVVAFDHRGYGGSTGTASIDGLMRDGTIVYDHIKALPIASAHPLIVHGHSLGSFIAGDIAKQRKIDGLVLESSATSAEEWVQGFADRSLWIRKGKVDASLKGKGNAEVMSTLDEPALIVVGKNDTTTRPEMSMALYEQAVVSENKKELLIVEAAGHMDASIRPEFRASFLRLLDRAQTVAPN